MSDIYIFMIGALALLAIIDLVVGVSNDAVNFLNSAIGSKALSVRNIMIIASFGVALGAITSSGMMEVARKGIFVPGEYYFNEIMYIFMAVMITDVLLLDLFNTLGMPTSTTVSIVFELLGAAVAVALIKISNKGKLGSFYNIGSNRNAINLEICKNLIQISRLRMRLGKNVKIKFVKDRPGHDIRYALNSNKLIKELKWKPKTSFKEGLKKTVNWYMNNLKYYSKINKSDIHKRIGLNIK